ncbi:TPA: ShlB/FhaC/HecB family hemolysin secretion/activation protein [Salmonella enterica]|nr:ShlB/FhaC/HecB family hemolysin secretion/activation protein [Salmonella enterica subsp. enterica serovar Chester]EGE9388775.1 ShlB/FhaC/HecB family hemolysin secretion/activation protein [Salmonella enterica subsp. enterica serovar Bredeney]EGL8376472.1 ShlB/FhaC/HecB family hemolysin secretion/activation protein [Salmonella enterica]EJO2520674.1 ShlB/FhaC/HecB family hemolysin secretion/activation protein [Salmonella enterica]HAF2404753.1 ShlB/FhaC/HecB family hemolysin secretion/activatio
MEINHMSEPSFRLRMLPAALSHILSAGRLCVPAAVFSVCLPLSVQAAPALQNAGTLGNQLRQAESHSVHIPELTAPDVAPLTETSQASRDASSARVTLKHIRLSGAPVTPSVPVEPVLRAYTGKPLSFTDLRALTSELTGLYRDAGLMAARVVIPRQVIRDGELSLTVLPGTADRASVRNSAPVREGILTRVAAAATPEGEPVMRKQVERLSLLLNEIPGVEGRVSLKPGEKSGTTAVVADVRPGKRAGGYVGLDNQGTQSTGRSRVQGGAYVNGLLGTGDQLRLDGAVGYEHGGLVNGRLDYNLLVSGYGTRAGAAYSRLDYQYDFMQAGFQGYSDDWEVYVSHPLVRTGTAQVNVRASAGQSFLTDKYPQKFSMVGGTEGKKTASTGTLGVVGSVATVPGGVTGAGMDLTVGRVRYQDETSRFWSGSDVRGTDDSFFTLNYQVQHDQQIYGPLQASIRLTGQETSGNLDTSRKFLLGGPSAVRAYDVGAGAVDRGVVATAEVTATWSLPSGFWAGGSPFVTAGAFYDHGNGQQNRDNITPSGRRLTDRNEVNLGGGGLFASVGVPGNYAVTATWARASSGRDPVSGVRDDDRIWLSAVKTF